MSTATATTRTNGRGTKARKQIVDANGRPVGRQDANGRAKPAAKPEPQRPVDEVRLGRVRAAIWQDVAKSRDGREFARFNVTFERLYLNGDGDWRSTRSFGRDDLLLLGKVAEAAFERINDLQMERPV